MTLVVGVRTATKMLLVSDTRITHPDVTQIEEIPGRLKLITLSPSICVGYAGPADLAVDHVRGTPAAAKSSFDLALAHFSEEQRCDFLLVESHSLRLATIKNGFVEESSLGYVGDDDAWKAFAAAREDTIQPESDDPELALIGSALGAFTRVLDDESHPTVAGFALRVGLRVDGFHYLEKASTYFAQVGGPLNEATAEPFSDAAAGGYSYTVLTPREPRHAVVAVHIHQGRFGFVYVPMAHDKPIRVADVDHAGLRAFVKQHYGVDVDGLRIGPARLGVPGSG